MDTDLKEEEAGAGVNNEAKAGDVTNEDVMDLELEGVTDVNLEDVLVETEDENNMNVREVLELEDEMAQDDMNTKRKEKRNDVFVSIWSYDSSGCKLIGQDHSLCLAVWQWEGYLFSHSLFAYLTGISCISYELEHFSVQETAEVVPSFSFCLFVTRDK